MNIYLFHSKPETLLCNKIAYQIVPELFWPQYRDNPEELKKREKYIAKDTFYSYWYAKNILQKPFHLGEEAISKDAKYSCWYASNIIKGPFILGEEAISKNIFYSYLYERDILKKPFIAAGNKLIEYKQNMFCILLSNPLS